MNDKNNYNNNNNDYNNNTGPAPTRLAIAWLDLTFRGQSVLPWRESRAILNGVNGSVNFGSLTALMGPSGAGKSTLLKCVNGRNQQGLDTGRTQLYVSSEQKMRSCFIVQDVSEHLLGGLTAIQSLVYASKLKNSPYNVSVDHKASARRLLKELSIADTENTSVSNCSGGEQKRLAIAMELMLYKKPNLLCIDEPTSGLDSNAAEIVIRVLKSVARKHQMAIVTSIHQPNNDVLMLFDTVYVLAKGGHCVYEGTPLDIGPALTAAQIECTEHQVPIEVMLRVASKPDENVRRLAVEAAKNRSLIRNRCQTEGRLVGPGGKVDNKSNKFSWAQTWYLFRRTLTFQIRSQWKATLAQFAFFMVLGTMLTYLYNDDIAEPDSCFSLADKQVNVTCGKTVRQLREENLLSQNFRFVWMSAYMLEALLSMATILLFASEIRVFMNERKNGWYSTGSYFMSKNISELPVLVATSVCFYYITFKTTHQYESDGRDVGCFIAMLAGAIAGQGLGFFMGIAFNASFKTAVVADLGVIILNLLFCGFFAPLQELPRAVRQLSHLSFIKQVFEIHLYLLYGFDRCPEGQVPAILYQHNLLDKQKFWLNWPALVANGLALRGLAFWALYAKTNSVSLQSMLKWPKSSGAGRRPRVDSMDESGY